MKIDIIDKNLLRIIKVKLCVENVRDIEEIESISISNINLMQKKLNINLKEIVKLKKLKELDLKFFEITDDIIEVLNELKFLERIEFAMCKFNTTKPINEKIKSISIYNCTDFSLNILDEKSKLKEIELTHSGLVDITKLNKFKTLEYLKIANCNVISIPSISILENLQALLLNEIELQCDLDITKMKKLELISLNGSRVANKSQYIQKLKEQNTNVIIEFRENNLPIE